MSTLKSAPVFLFAALLLCACATPPQGPLNMPALGDNEAMIAPNVVFTIPPPSAVGQSANVAQTIVADFRRQAFSFDAQIQLSPAELDLVALDGFGRRALTVNWKASGIEHTEAPWLPPYVRPADILADIAVVYWPADVLAQSLKRSGAVVREWHRIRTISANKRDLIVVKYGRDGEGWGRSAKLKNLAFGYEIDIQSAEIGP